MVRLSRPSPFAMGLQGLMRPEGPDRTYTCLALTGLLFVNLLHRTKVFHRWVVFHTWR